ncbi:MAG TPA: histidine--tRNA ligase [Thermoanaerobaculia bacterium]
MRDLDPALMLERERVLDIIRGVYQNYGFVPLQTPAIEHVDVLFGSAGEESHKQMFRVSGPDADHLALRFDLTVPLARFYAQHPELPRPFRRYQCSPVWRADKPEKGRYREFTQFDIDSIGVPSELADAEIIACICDTLQKLRLRYQVKFSSRALLNLLLHFAGIPLELGIEVFRVLDKFDKFGIDRVRDELTRSREQGGLGLLRSQVERIELFLAIKGTRKEIVQQVCELFRHVRGAADEITTVRNISDHLDAMGYHEDRVIIDLSIARGLSYYTGPVFEAVALDAPELGSILGGGRYDDLVERFGGGRVPATGASIGVDRLLDVLERLKLTYGRKATARVLVTNMDPALTSECLAMTQQLREAGIATELYLGSERGMKKQLKHADMCAIPIALLYGSNEHAHGTVTLKNLIEGQKETNQLQERVEYLLERKGQREYPRTELVAAVRHLLSAIEHGYA